MLSKEPTPTDLINFRHHQMAHRYMMELARISAWLFIGVLALMTFLLTVGLQHPQPLFSYFCYTSVIILPLNLLVFAITNLVASNSTFKSTAEDVPAADDAKSETKSDAKSKAAKPSMGASWVKALRLTQQILFMLSLVAVTGLALVSAHIFFAPPAAAPQQVQQGQ